jgi:hypothetical protein
VKRTYVIPLIALLTFILGTASIMLPFLPFGWALYAVTALILLPYFKPLRKFFTWIVSKDNSGIALKVGLRVAKLYAWAGDFKKEQQVNDAVQDAENSRPD